MRGEVEAQEAASITSHSKGHYDLAIQPYRFLGPGDLTYRDEYRRRALE